MCFFDLGAVPRFEIRFCIHTPDFKQPPQKRKKKRKERKQNKNKTKQNNINDAKIDAFIWSKTFNRFVRQELSWFLIPLSNADTFSCSCLSRICRTSSSNEANIYIYCLCLDNSLKIGNKAKLKTLLPPWIFT